MGESRGGIGLFRREEESEVEDDVRGSDVAVELAVDEDESTVPRCAQMLSGSKSVFKRALSAFDIAG